MRDGLTCALVLRGGGDFKEAHVERLAAQLPGRVVCLTDGMPRGVRAVSLEYDWPGWWAKLELMDTVRQPGDLLYVDLDTLIAGPLDDILAACAGDAPILLEDFYRPGGLQSAMMYLPEAARAEAWAAFTRDPAGIMPRFPSDQEFLETLWLRSARRWQDELPGQIVSYKAHCGAGVPDGARVVIFHGKPRPWETPLWHDARADEDGEA